MKRIQTTGRVKTLPAGLKRRNGWEPRPSPLRGEMQQWPCKGRSKQTESYQVYLHYSRGCHKPTGHSWFTGHASGQSSKGIDGASFTETGRKYLKIWFRHVLMEKGKSHMKVPLTAELFFAKEEWGRYPGSNTPSFHYWRRFAGGYTGTGALRNLNSYFKRWSTRTYQNNQHSVKGPLWPLPQCSKSNRASCLWEGPVSSPGAKEIHRFRWAVQKPTENWGWGL